jgi:hypothetical protein
MWDKKTCLKKQGDVDAFSRLRADGDLLSEENRNLLSLSA